MLQSLDEEPDAKGHISPALLRDWREIPSEALERQETRSLPQAAVGQLSPMYREIFLLRDVEELSITEKAEVLQITESSVKVRLHRARIMLQKVLAPQLRHMIPQKDSQRRRWFPWL